MWAMKVAYYRAFQKVMKIFMMFLDWSEPQLLTGPGAIKKLPGVIKDKGINNVMIVTDKGLMSFIFLTGFSNSSKRTAFHIPYMTVFSQPLD